MKKSIEVPKGRQVITATAAGHSYVAITDASGNEVFRFNSSGEHISAALPAGSYTVETDGKLSKVDIAPSDRLKVPERNGQKPPAAPASQ